MLYRKHSCLSFKNKREMIQHNVEDIHEFYHVPVTQWEWDLSYVYLMSSIKIYDSITLKNKIEKESRKGEEWKVFRFFYVRLYRKKNKSVCFLRTQGKAANVFIYHKSSRYFQVENLLIWYISSTIYIFYTRAVSS